MSVEKQGSLSITSENIFPVIKKWLYSDHDIFVRELVSNGCDAITKLKKLDMIGEYQFPDNYRAKIDVICDPEAKTLKFVDNGIGMTAEEVDEYINQIAFSGATEFLEKYKDKATDDQIIGHFGLGFYSAFMVSDRVDINTLSFQEGAEPVFWTCDGGTEFSMSTGSRSEVGTEITLHIMEDCLQFCNEYKIREVLDKYCAFMPTEIFLSKANAPQEYEVIDEEDLLETDVVVEHVHEEPTADAPARETVRIHKRPEPVNDSHPLWLKHPNECSDEDYKQFYQKVFNDYREPLFWIHLNMDYPFNLKGILYFPKIDTEYDSIQGKIKLFNSQVFIADNIKEVIPEFLMLLKGVIDCPDLPLNVSRSALQNDGFVKKISDYITKKVADKLSGMCKVDRENYESYWDGLHPFIKYGCIKDDKFNEKMADYILFADLSHKYMTLKEYYEAMGWNEEAEDTADEDVTPEVITGEETDEEVPDAKHTIYFVSDEKQQIQYINLFRNQGMNAVLMQHNIDPAFISLLEKNNEDLAFARIDADLSEELGENASEEEQESLTAIVRKALGKEDLEVRIARLKDESVASMITLSDENRRMEDIFKMYRMEGLDDSEFNGTLVLNAAHPLVQFINEHKRSKNVPMICEQLYDLAKLAYKPLKPEEMARFIQRSNEIMLALTK